MIEAKAKSVGVSAEEMTRKYVSQASMGRMVTADDIASQILFVCSDAGQNISGQPISVDADTQYIL